MCLARRSLNRITIITIITIAGMQMLATAVLAAGQKRLGDLAANITLRADGADARQSICITNDSLIGDGEGGRMTTASTTVVTAADVVADKPPGDIAKVRLKWRQRYDRQKKRLNKAEQKLTKAVRKIADLERKRFASGVGSKQDVSLRQRLIRAREGRDLAAKERDRERQVLNRLVREARREGAQPGWFR